jgi:hypothetical protein
VKARVPFLTNLSQSCGGVREPAFCLFGCFWLIAFGLWTIVNTDWRQRLRAVVFGVSLVVFAFPVAVFSGAWITCAVGDYDSPAAGVAALLQASVKPRFARN